MLTLTNRHTTPNLTRQLAVVLRDVLARETFHTYADLVVALKERCAQLKVPWTINAIAGAITLVESNTRVVQPVVRRRQTRRQAPVGLSRTEAAATLERLGVRLR